MLWDNFWPNFAADSLVAIIFAPLIIWFNKWLKRPRLSLLIGKEYSKENNIHWLDIVVRNDGRTAMGKGDVNWHLYIPTILQWHQLEANKYPIDYAGDSLIYGLNCKHVRNYNINDPIFPEREITVARLQINTLPQETIRVYYHFSTSIGLRPRRVWRKCWYREIQGKEGNLRTELLPFVEIKY